MREYNSFEKRNVQFLVNKRLTKHREIFWIDVENQIDHNKEYFRVKDTVHTKNPIVNQFVILMKQGHISVDFLLCRRTGGDAFSFKIDGKLRPLLFPQSETCIINKSFDLCAI